MSGESLFHFSTTDCRFWIIRRSFIFTEINKYTFYKNKNIRELIVRAYADNIVLIAETDNEVTNAANILYKGGKNWLEN